MAGATKAAAHGAPGLRRDAQGGTVVLGDENGLYRIAATHVKQPFDGAVCAVLPGAHAQGLHAGVLRQGGAQTFGNVGHGVEIADATLVQPRCQLLGPKGFFAVPFEPATQPV